MAIFWMIKVISMTLAKHRPRVPESRTEDFHRSMRGLLNQTFRIPKTLDPELASRSQLEGGPFQSDDHDSSQAWKGHERWDEINANGSFGHSSLGPERHSYVWTTR
jgi:hypothetical protein